MTPLKIRLDLKELLVHPNKAVQTPTDSIAGATIFSSDKDTVFNYIKDFIKIYR